MRAGAVISLGGESSTAAVLLLLLAPKAAMSQDSGVTSEEEEEGGSSAHSEMAKSVEVRTRPAGANNLDYARLEMNFVVLRCLLTSFLPRDVGECAMITRSV